MMRPALILILLLTTAIMMRGVASDWRQGQILPTEGPAKKSSPAPAEAVVPLPQVKDLQPTVPGILPDLKEGYLFNPERTLVEEKPQATKEETASTEIKEFGVDASIDEVTYEGSIIADAFSQAIIIYPGGAKKTKEPPQPASRSSRKAAAPQASGGDEHARLEVGDMLDGYELTEILPAKLIFSKGEEKVEKLLHDPDKKRIDAPRASGPMAGPPRPQQQGQGGPPSRQGGIQSTTIGGGSAPAPAPGTVANPSHPAPPLPAAASRPNLPPGASSPAEAPQMPVRRMVISRQPSPAPNTNKVLRQSQETVEMPPSPGMPPTNPIATPPVPGN